MDDAKVSVRALRVPQHESRTTPGLDLAVRGDPTALIVTYLGGRDLPHQTVVTRTREAWAALDRRRRSVTRSRRIVRAKHRAAAAERAEALRPPPRPLMTGGVWYVAAPSWPREPPTREQRAMARDMLREDERRAWQRAGARRGRWR